MEAWSCTICDITMQMQSREPHLAGSRHKTAARASWTCLICDIEMQMQNRDSHLAGRRHAEAEGASISQATMSGEASLTWTCLICNIEMQMQSRDSHLAGRRHAEAESESISQAAKSGEASLRWTCLICNIQVPIQQRNSHLASKRHTEACRLPNITTTASSSTTSKARSASYGIDGSTKNNTLYVTEAIEVAAWQCTMCACSVPLSGMQFHLSGLDHLRNVLEMIKITCMAISFQEPDNKLTAKEITGYQEVVKETKSLATYLENQISDKEVTAESSSTASNSTPMDRPRVKRPPETASSPPLSTGPLDHFFFSFPSFQYDPSLPPADSFRTLRDGLSRWNDFEESICSTWDEYKEDVYTRYQAALTREFNLWFGTDDDITSWHSLCRAIAIQPLPTTLKKCQKAVRNRHVNIVDLIQWARGREVGQVRIFRTVRELGEYSYAERKIYRKEQLEQGVVLRHLLRGLEKSMDE